MVSEISRIARRVVIVLNFVELLHEKGIALYIQQFNMLTLENEPKERCKKFSFKISVKVQERC
jgi:DNA invertase Pin-like site-specific DNA recombinase